VSLSIATQVATRLRAAHPDARYELDWSTPFELLVATILAGGSSDAAVNQVTPAMLQRWPDARALSRADRGALETIIRPLGLQVEKARRLQEAALTLVDRFGGEVPRTMEALLQLPGVQRKTANVVLTNAMGIAAGIIVDRHVARVAQRLGLSSQREPENIERDLMQQVPQAEWGHFGAASVLHGRRICTAQAPRCGNCPLADLCPSRDTDPRRSSAPQANPFAWPDEYQVPVHHMAKHDTLPGKSQVRLPESGAGRLPDDWAQVLAGDLEQPWYRELTAQVSEERRSSTVYPAEDEVFSAFHLTPFAATRVLLLGQDPYHGPGQAHGLAFSVKPGVKPPPSLVNIYKELQVDLGHKPPNTGCLEPWARKGVMLLNAVLTVRQGEANSHKALGWERLTDAVIRALNQREEHLVFVLWGAYARRKAAIIDSARHSVVEGAHPSPLSAKLWFGSRPFSHINAALEKHGQPAIDWRIDG
jgi:uracil-DNA glycosylase